MPGIFMMSFDCEGKWGIHPAEDLNSHHEYYFTNAKLTQEYKRILIILNKAEIKGTFAFVGAFTMSLEEYQANRDWFSDIFTQGKNVFDKFNQSAKKNNVDGWLNPSAFEMVLREKSHEMASHGFSHQPLKEDFITESIFLKEMELIKLVSRLKEIESKRFVYPLNIM